MLSASDSPFQTSQSQPEQEHDDMPPISPIHQQQQPQQQPQQHKSLAASSTSTSTSTTTTATAATTTSIPPPPRHPPSMSVTRLQQHLHQSLNEVDARVIFTAYDDQHEMTWSPLQVRRFLGDLQQAASYPRLLPDTYIDIALQELQLNVDTGGNITWIEWKSYCLLQQEEPLYHLHRQLSSHINAITYAHIPRCVIVDDVPPSLSIPDLMIAFSSLHPQHIYTGTIDDAPVRSLLLLLNSSDDVETALSMTSITHKGITIPIIVYNAQPNKEWPQWRRIRTSMPELKTSTEGSTSHVVSQTLAAPIILGYKAVGEVSAAAAELDEKLAISRSLAGSAHAISTQFTAIDASLGISQGVDMASQIVSDGYTHVSETLHLKQAGESLKEAARDVREQVSTAAALVGGAVLSNATIAEGYGWLKGWTSMVTETLSQVGSNTMQLVKEAVPDTITTTSASATVTATATATTAAATAATTTTATPAPAPAT